MWPWARRPSRNYGLPVNIFATAEARDFKFGTQLVFAKAHHKIKPRSKTGIYLGLGAPKNSGFPYNISTTAGASDFKFGAQLGFANANPKIKRRERVGMALG